MKKKIIMLSLCGILLACSQQEKMTIEQMRQIEIDRRVSQFIENKKNECYSQNMDRAIARADSLLKLNAVRYIEDSLQRPALPVKPELHIRPAPRDSIKPRPFIQSALNDSTRSRPLIDSDTVQ